MDVVIGFIVGIAAFFIGIIFFGCIAYREGVEDTKKGKYTHAHCWHHHKKSLNRK